MISTKDLSYMLKAGDLQRVCKGISALEIIMSEDWDIRYYSYNSEWGEKEEVFEMRNGSDQHMLILFGLNGCAISGVDEELYDWERDIPKIEDITLGLPGDFHEFMYGEPVKSLKSTFCIWTVNDAEWNTGTINNVNDGSKIMLDILDGNPQKYIDFCKWYYETELPFDIVEKVYRGEPLTLEMIACLNSERDDMDAIKSELIEIGYPNTL